MWTCSKCEETSEEEFGLCWKCQTPRGDVIYVPEGSSEPAEAPEAPVESVPEFVAENCPRCDEPRMMEDLPVVSPSQDPWSYPAVEVEVSRNPHPLLARDSVRAELRARVCASCGHAEFYVLGASALWPAWRMMQSAETAEQARPPAAPPPIPPPPQTPEAILREAARKPGDPPLRPEPATDPEPRSPIGARCVLSRGPGSGDAADFLPRSGRILSTHADPGGGREWWLLQLDRTVEGTMRIGSATRYQRIEADACLLRGTGAAPPDPRRWKAQNVEARWVLRGAWQPGGAVQAEGVLPLFTADCSPEAKP
jgi:hypothetical protein